MLPVEPGETSEDHLSSSVSSVLLICGNRKPDPGAKLRATSPLEQRTSFGALAHADPVDLVSAWIAAREKGDVKLATALCAEDLHFESGGEASEYFEISGRDSIAREIFGTPAPPLPPRDVIKALHLVAKSDGSTRSTTSAYIVARELRIQEWKLRQEFTVINLKGWRNAMIILRIAVTRGRLQDDDLEMLATEKPWAALAMQL